MNMTNNATPEQEIIQEQGQEQIQQEKPEIAVKEDGTLEVNSDAFFFDEIPDEDVSQEQQKEAQEKQTQQQEKDEKGVEEEKQEQEAEPKEEKKSPKDYPDVIEEDGVTKYKVVVQGEVQYVTLEELRKGYQRQSDYTKKTQKLSEEKKRLEEEKRKVEELLKSVELQANYRLTKEEMLNVVNQAERIVKEQYGLDEYDDNYETLKNAIVTDMANQIKKQKEAQEKFMRVEQWLQQRDPDYEQISQLALQIMENELPLAKVRELERAKAEGDPMPFLELYRTAAERYRKQKKQQQPVNEKIQDGKGLFNTQQPQTQPQAQPKPKVEPPVAERPNIAYEDNTKKTVDPTELAGKTTDEQARLLIEMGLI